MPVSFTHLTLPTNREGLDAVFVASIKKKQQTKTEMNMRGVERSIGASTVDIENDKYDGGEVTD